MHKVHFLNTHDLMLPTVHGEHAKDMIVLHETVSPDLPGLADIIGVERYLKKVGYGIHGMTDLEGHIAWALGLGKAIMYHCGGVNERSIGIEQVSYIPALLASKHLTMKQAAEHWQSRRLQLHATAQLCAAIHHAQGVPLTYSDGLKPGVTTHWDVSQHFSASEGHTDCHPVNKDGYYPVLEVIALARSYASVGYQF